LEENTPGRNVCVSLSIQLEFGVTQQCVNADVAQW